MSECIEWWGNFKPNGYGYTMVDGRQELAHRHIYRECFGPIPDDRPFVLHSCDNPPCVNPEHLRAGTPQDNMNDRKLRGRWLGPPSVLACVNGHEFTDDNTYHYTDAAGLPHRACRTCKTIKMREYRARRKVS